ncbi:hemin uptake protein HemP [Amaricoccus solimangrovi]|uniref:Hemin uptake protein HemP n=1 Tax=Amaricoccus solimangrovi TaxID=2589815 RepID=A0A501WZR9_9RHOB|nr:hemin uptake protein HemP [Amaricoccus solimangrovi]TPE52651.1 hemin uptake protein HemP [Amaricoccus solimangrovi]
MNAPFHPRRDTAQRVVEIKPRPTHDARLLTGGGAEATIVLDGTLYVLRITRQGKLILTK